jgi:VWFA-related protein
MIYDDLSSILRGFSVSRSVATTAVAALLACNGAQLLCQTQSATSTLQMPGQMQDPTRPEIQPRLDVDRDPIPSPDIEEIAPATAASPLGPAKPGEIQKRQDGIYTMHQDVDEVLLNCAVVDEKGRPVEDLGRSDFRIYEDGVSQATTSFIRQDQPVSLGILVDNSGSMLDKRAAVHAATVNLLRASNPRDSTFIVNFSDRAYLDQGFTSDIGALSRGLSRVDSKGYTALYDAVAASADELSRNGKLPKQVLLVITDGADNASRLELEEAVGRVQRLGGPVVYTIGLLYGADKDEAQRAKTALERLSAETGGIAYFPHSLEDVDSIALAVAHDIRDQYTIGYRSTKPPNLEGYRTIRVEAAAPKHGKLIVRTRKGYYAKKPATQQHTQTAQVINQ